MADADLDDLDIFESRRRLLGIAAVALAFVLVGIFLVVIGDSESRRWGLSAPVAGWIGLGVFGPVLAHLSWRLLVAKRSPQLTLTADGFYDRTPMGGTYVEWTELKSLKVIDLGSTKCVAGRVRDPARLHSQRSGLRRLVARVNRRHGDIWIAESSISMTAEELRGLMVERWRAARPRQRD